MERFGDRVAEAREAMGIGQSELARRVGVSPQAIQAIEANKAAGSVHIVKIARELGVTPEWLDDGISPRFPQGVPALQEIAVAGYVGAGQEVFSFDDYPIRTGMKMVKVPSALGDSVAVEIRGNSMFPRYSDGEVIVYDRKEGDPAAMLKRECVVSLTDGRKFLKVLGKGSRARRYHLVSHNAETIEDAQLEWAAPVKWPERLSPYQKREIREAAVYPLVKSGAKRQRTT